MTLPNAIPSMILAGCHVPMTKSHFLLSVTNEDNDFQIEQVKAARQVASKANVELEVLSARDDGILQSQQLLHRIQSAAVSRPNAVLSDARRSGAPCSLGSSVLIGLSPLAVLPPV